MFADGQLLDAGALTQRVANSSTTMAPPPITSTRPSCMGPSAARSGPRHTDQLVADGEQPVHGDP